MAKDSEEKLVDDAYMYWNRSDAWTQKVSHWRGSPRTPVGKWEKIGEENWTRFEKLVYLAGQDLEGFRKMVEWGCGGGANVARFAQHFKHVYGIDVSEETLHEADSQMARLKLADRFWPFPIHADFPHHVRSMQKADSLPVRGCLREHYPHIGNQHDMDFFLSTSCFQHFPSKSYAEKVLRMAYWLLCDHGLALIQARLDDGGSYHAPKDHDYCGGNNRNAIRFMSHTVEEFTGMCNRAGFNLLCEPEMQKANYMYFYLERA
jgi:hypothetical protein